MKRTTLFIAVVLWSFTSLHAQTTPLQFNNDIAKISDSLFIQGKKWGATFNDAYKSGDYSILKPVADALQIFLDVKTVYVEKLKDVKNSKPLRMAMLDFLGFEKKMLQENFRPFEAFTSSTPKDQIQAAITSLLEKAKNEDEFIKKVTDKQEVYASENGFIIESKE